jgi:hypothetical protein
MKPTTKLTALAAALSLTTVLVACGGGGGSTDTAGIGGSGFVSSGTITGFGSVFVNGVKFETTRSSFDIEGTQGTQDDLAIGMVVKVNGTINPDGVTGTATSIVFDDDLQGPVLGYPTTGTANLTTTKFTVMGISVQIDRRTTHFDSDNGGISFDTITDGDMVELSGFFDGTGTLIASRIENKTGSDENVELKGTIAGLIGNTFTLQGIAIDASGASLKDLPNGLLNNIRVEVKGEFDGTKIIATEVESEEFEYGDSDEFEMEGFITDFTSHSNFKVNGITVDASRAEIEPRNMQLANNLQIEVEGRYVNNVLIADEIKMRGGDVEVSAPIASIDTTNNRFTLEPANGQILIIQTGTETQFEDNDDSYSVRITNLSVGDFVEVEGFLNEDDNIFASEVKITEPDEIEIQGIVEGVTLTTVTILGINFETTASPVFESDNSSINTLSQLRDSVNAGNQILVKVELPNNNTNVITKIEIED